MAKDTIGIDVSKDRLDAFWHSRSEARRLPNTDEGFGQMCDWLGEEEGVLIVFERKVFLNDAIKTGTVLDAAVSSMLLKNLFFPNAALHDGATDVGSNFFGQSSFATYALTYERNLVKVPEGLPLELCFAQVDGEMLPQFRLATGDKA